MVKSGQRADAIVDVGFRPGLGSRSVETFDVQSLMSRRSTPASLPSERLGFDLLIVCVTGRGRHMIDFVDIDVRPARVIHLRPGQVHRWIRPVTYQAQMVLSRHRSRVDELGELSIPGTGADTVHDLAGEEWDRFLVLVDVLRWEQDRFDGSPVAAAGLTSVFDVMVSRLARHRSARVPVAVPPAYAAFRRELEATVGSSRSVQDYARRIGYSARTVSRACLQVTGETAKQVLDARIALEAQRLLANSSESIEAIGRSLGFSEATNFTKFFKRRVGRTPKAFRLDVT